MLDARSCNLQDEAMHHAILIIHNVRSCHNVGSLLRTAEGLGVERVYLTGYTPYPLAEHDTRLPHLARKLDAQIHKTALGAERLMRWEPAERIETVIDTLRAAGFRIIALEQDEKSVKLSTFHAPDHVALIVGREVEGIEPAVLAVCDRIVEIPMRGKKESFNVAAAAAIALYTLTND